MRATLYARHTCPVEGLLSLRNPGRYQEAGESFYQKIGDAR